MVSTPTISRQRPGSACEECRRRKVRCDRRRPQCQVCFETGIESALERCLADQHPEINHQMASLFNSSLVDMDPGDDPLKDLPSLPDFSDDRGTDIKSPTSSDSQPRTTGLVSEFMRADLDSDQLYFDRVHPFAPILQRWRYHVWAKLGKKTDAQTCLQYAMWTVAASLSAQFQSFRDTLYQETRQMLDSLEVRTPRSVTMSVSSGPGIEQAQAWVLVSIYEYMHLSPQQAWMSAGRCCRLVLGMRLYELDDPNNPITMAREQDEFVDWTGLEEQRRTFWMAYSLDRFISFHNGLPFTLNEQLISTRLPAPEEEFQAGQPVVTRFLAEVMARSCLGGETAGGMVVSPFGESVVLATICGRALSHRQKLAVEQINGDVFDGLWTRHQWLHELLSHRIQVLSTSTQVDSMLIFARIVAQTMVLYLHNVLESIVWKTGDHLLGIIEYERLCVLAAHEVVNLVKLQGQLGYFKVHPLTPIPLMMCTEFFTAHGYLDSSFDGMLRELLECLQDLDRAKNPVQSPQLSVT
ncbi:hypothetical protein N8T08_004646 [Aspergillus melleus]|uniref:Uncharacterized protein n=1 Tax=Aspergillus melleus TaxID=138277 RepID=A0ACC3B457_9EURO|nr:hypothetical protein N8T08_004646 [Aspergillus melleus]